MFSNTSAFTNENGVGSCTDSLGQTQPGYNTSFENLILKKVVQHSRNAGNKNSTKVTPVVLGSKVITRSYLEKHKEREVEDIKKPQKKSRLVNLMIKRNISKKKPKNKKSRMVKTSDETKIQKKREVEDMKKPYSSSSKETSAHLRKNQTI